MTVPTFAARRQTTEGDGMTTVWLCEYDLGGYDYSLMAIFANQETAQEFCSQHKSDLQAREVIVHDSIPEDWDPNAGNQFMPGYWRPVCWG